MPLRKDVQPQLEALALSVYADIEDNGEFSEVDWFSLDGDYEQIVRDYVYDHGVPLDLINNLMRANEVVLADLVKEMGSAHELVTDAMLFYTIGVITKEVIKIGQEADKYSADEAEVKHHEQVLGHAKRSRLTGRSFRR